MSFTKRTSAVIAAALAAMLISAAPQAVQAQGLAITPATPAQIETAISAPKGEPNFIFVGVCDPKAQVCSEYKQNLAMNSALIQGGWTAGVQNMHTTAFFSLDKSAANVQDLAKICAAANLSAVEQSACKALASALIANPFQPTLLIMINRTTGDVETIDVYQDQLSQSRSIVAFVRK